MFVKKVNDYFVSTLLMCEVLNVYVCSVLKDFSPLVRGIFLGMTEMIAFCQFAILFRRTVQCSNLVILVDDKETAVTMRPNVKQF